MHDVRILELLRKYIERTINEAELEELTVHLEREDTSVSEALGALAAETPELADYKEEDWDPVYQRIEARLPGRTRGLWERLPEPPRWLWAPIAAAAAIVLLLLGVFLHKQASGPLPPAVAHDVAPGGNKATLTLADGRVINLKDAKDGVIDKQDKAKVVKKGDGALAYQMDQNETGTGNTFNTLATPRAGQYSLTLSDGTKVWLNAASSLRYPPAFHGRERVVELNGEAYFEVAPQNSPFKVIVSRTASPVEVDVLGTHFDIMAYADEPHIQTTLLEGSVRVKSGDRSVLLRPGRQALEAGFTQKVDTEEVVAWKNGLFKFNEATLPQVMRQVSRWYDVEVVYQHTPAQERFGGEMYRNVPVSKLLKVLQASGVHFTVEGKKIIVH